MTRDAIARAVDSSLSAYEIDAILSRRALIVTRFEELIRERGETAVLY